MSREHQASGPLAGYLWQTDLALLRLFDLDLGERIEVETFDDVVQVKGGGQILGYIQAKHSLAPSRLTARSADLWKTLRIWIPLAEQLLESGQISRFELATTDEVAAELMSLEVPSSERELPREAVARQALSKQLDAIAAEEPNKGLRESYSVWKESSLATRSLLLRNTFLLGHQGRIAETARKFEHCLRRKGVPSTALEEYRERIVGWFEAVLRERLNEDGCSIEYEELVEVISELHQNLSPKAFPARFARESVPDMIAAEYRKTYQLQLRLLKASEEDLFAAYEMHTRARLERENWLNSRITGQSDLQDHDNELINLWAGSFRRGKRKQRNEQLDPITTGWEIFDECMRNKSVVHGSQVAHHVHVGSLHLLSDHPAQKPTIGWHPEYRKLLIGLLNSESDE